MNTPKIILDNPCDKTWNDMVPAKDGHFCAYCNKHVVNFTRKTYREIKNYPLGDQEYLCGSFTIKQLEPELVEASTLFTPVKKIMVAVVSMISYEIAGSNLIPSTENRLQTTLTQQPSDSAKIKKQLVQTPAKNSSDSTLHGSTRRYDTFSFTQKGGFYFSKRFPFLHYRKRVVRTGRFRIDE